VIITRPTDSKPHTPVNSPFLDEFGMPTPQSTKGKRPDVPMDRDNALVDRILKKIPDLKSLGKVQLEQLLATEAGQIKLRFKVSPEEFKRWKANIEDIGGYEYNYSREEIIIKADIGAVHENTVQLMSRWLGNFEESNKNVNTSLGEGMYPTQSSVSLTTDKKYRV
jgi:hypothetical protein